MHTCKTQLFAFLAFGLIFATLFVTSDAKKNKDKNTAAENSNEEEEDQSSGKKEQKDKFYRKRDLERITQLMAEISELQNYLQYEQTFLTELLISSFSQPKPEVIKVENFNFKPAAKNLTKALDKFYSRNTLTGRPAKMVVKHLEKRPFQMSDSDSEE